MQHDGHVTTSDSAATRRRGPLDPRLLRRGRATLGYLIAGVAVGSATAVLTLVQASALARALGDIFATHTLTVLQQAPRHGKNMLDNRRRHDAPPHHALVRHERL